MNRETNFRRYMDMAHRRPAYGVNSPAVFRHLVFRIDDPSRSHRENPLRAVNYDDAREARNKFIADVNERLKAVQTCCHAERIYLFGFSGARTAAIPDSDLSTDKPPRKEDIETKPSNVSYVEINRTLLTELRPKLAHGDDHGWRIRLLVDFHTEYFSLTFILDQPNDVDAAAIIGDARTALNIEEMLSKRRGSHGDPEIKAHAANATPDIKSAEMIKFLYEDVWQRIEPHICAFTPGTPGQPTDDNLGMPGTLITEFRAVALRDLESKFAMRIVGKKSKPIYLPGNPATDSDFAQSRYRLREWVMHNGDIVREILKFNQLTQKLDRDANCVLCEVLDGGAIYGSSLGQLPPADSIKPGKQTIPLRYFIIYNALSKYQLGRLIRRHHVLGELRMAALSTMT